MSQMNAGLMASKYAAEVPVRQTSVSRTPSRHPTTSPARTPSNSALSGSRHASPSSHHSSLSRSAASAPVLPSQTGVNPPKSVAGPNGKMIKVRLPPPPSVVPPRAVLSTRSGQIVVRLPKAPEVENSRGRSRERRGESTLERPLPSNQAGASGETAVRVPSMASDKRLQAVSPQREREGSAGNSSGGSPHRFERKRSPSIPAAGSRNVSPAGPLTTEEAGKYLDRLAAADYPVVEFRPNSSMLVSDGIITIAVAGKRIALPYGAKNWSAFTNECQHRMTSPFVAFQKARGMRKSNDVPSLGLFLRKSIPRQPGAAPYYAIGFEDPEPVASNPPSTVASWIASCLQSFPAENPFQTLAALSNAWRGLVTQNTSEYDLTWLVYPPSAKTGFPAADVGALVGFRNSRLSFLGPVRYLPWVPYAGTTAKQAYVAANSYEQDRAQGRRTDAKAVRGHLQIRIWQGYDKILRVALKLKDNSPARIQLPQGRGY